MRLRAALAREEGFSLIEVLIVALVIALLAAIALTSFLQEQKKGWDSDAKSNARELVSHIEACFVEKSDYTDCDSPAELATILNFPYGNGSGEAEILGAGEQSFTVIGHSRSGSDFHIVKTDGSRPERTCSPRDGGCRSNGTW
jgi:prepilin-type N-terminal cleavage/methylation domain-containing protein